MKTTGGRDGEEREGRGREATSSSARPSVPSRPRGGFDEGGRSGAGDAEQAAREIRPVRRAEDPKTPAPPRAAGLFLFRYSPSPPCPVPLLESGFGWALLAGFWDRRAIPHLGHFLLGFALLLPSSLLRGKPSSSSSSSLVPPFLVLSDPKFSRLQFSQGRKALNLTPTHKQMPSKM